MSLTFHRTETDEDKKYYSSRPIEPTNTPENISRLVRQLSSSTKSSFSVKREALDVLWNLATIDPRTSECVCASGYKEIMEIAKHRLVEESEEQKELSYLAVATLAALVVSDKNKPVLHDADALNLMIELLKKKDPELRLFVTDFIAELAFYSPKVAETFRELDGFSYLVDVINSIDDDIQISGIRAIWHMVLLHDDYRKDFITNTGLSRLVLLHEDSSNEKVRSISRQTLDVMALCPRCKKFIRSCSKNQ